MTVDTRKHLFTSIINMKFQYRRKMGAFKPKGSPKALHHEKGYRLRDTDDRLVRQKLDEEKSLPAVKTSGNAPYRNGLCFFSSSL